jgi:hypothetical protein
MLMICRGKILRRSKCPSVMRGYGVIPGCMAEQQAKLVTRPRPEREPMPGRCLSVRRDENLA